MMTVRLVAAISLALCPFATKAAPPPAQVAAICAARSGCELGESHAAGGGQSGEPLTIVEANLGIEQKPEYAPADGCRKSPSPGGTEYWLLEGALSPRLVLKLCNEGYGSSGVGNDEVTIEANRLIHGQFGGSAWRSETSETFSLSPLRLISSFSCGYNFLIPKTMGMFRVDYMAMLSRSIDDDPDYEKEAQAGCPAWPSDDNFRPRPAVGLLATYSIFRNERRLAVDAPPLPSRITLDGCLPAMTTAGANGFLINGNAAPSAEAAEVRMLAETSGSLLVQIFDPLAIRSSGADRPHVEVWTGRQEPTSTTPLVDRFSQTIVELDGAVHAGAGKPIPVPPVERWEARDASGRPVVVLRISWPTYTFLDGVAVAYAQAKNGRHVRTVATTGVEKDRPLILSGLTSLFAQPRIGDAVGSPACVLRDGRLVRP
jgi:hypothetical protein